MPLKDLSGKTVHDLEPDEFKKLYCSQCRYYQQLCERRFKDINACHLLIDSGTWDSLYRKRQGEVLDEVRKEASVSGDTRVSVLTRNSKQIRGVNVPNKGGELCPEYLSTTAGNSPTPTPT
jgi:hypothetical protein